MIIGDRKLTVVARIDKGRRGVVYKVKDESNRYYALKIAKDHNSETLDSLKKEASTAAQLARLEIPHATVIVSGPNFALKNWIEGIRGDEVVSKVLAGQMDKSVMTHLFPLSEKIMSQGAYIGDFRPKNLIWSGKAWFVVDSGGITEDITFAEAKAKFNEKFERRWPMPLQCADTF